MNKEEPNKKVETPVPPQREFPQEEPDSDKNKGIQQKPDPEKKKKDEDKPKTLGNP